MKLLVNKPYDLLASKLFRMLFVIGGTAYAFILLWLFEPYGVDNMHEKNKIIGLYVGTGGVLMFLQFFPLQNLLFKRYTLINSILWLMLSFVIVGISSFIINAYLYFEGHFYLDQFFYFQGVILSTNIVPIVLIVLIHYNYSLKKRLKNAVDINKEIGTKNNTSAANNPIIKLNSNNKRENIELSLDFLLYISSTDNYIEVNMLANETTDKKLLRYSLTGIITDNSAVIDLFRCHKSYIINKRKIESISGNAAGYKIKLLNVEEQIPVSRKLNRDIKSLIN